MPKLYQYFGIIVLFYSNEHEPVHVHGKCQGKELRAEIIIVEGEIVEIRYSSVFGRPPLEPQERKYFEEIVFVKADEIVKKWIDFFVFHKSISPETINRRLKNE